MIEDLSFSEMIEIIEKKMDELRKQQSDNPVSQDSLIRGQLLIEFESFLEKINGLRSFHKENTQSRQKH